MVTQTEHTAPSYSATCMQTANWRWLTCSSQTKNEELSKHLISNSNLWTKTGENRTYMRNALPCSVRNLSLSPSFSVDAVANHRRDDDKNKPRQTHRGRGRERKGSGEHKQQTERSTKEERQKQHKQWALSFLSLVIRSVSIDMAALVFQSFYGQFEMTTLCHRPHTHIYDFSVRCTPKLLTVDAIFFANDDCGRRHRHAVFGIHRFIRLELEYVIFARDFHTASPLFLQHICSNFVLCHSHTSCTRAFSSNVFYASNGGQKFKFHFE